MVLFQKEKEKRLLWNNALYAGLTRSVIIWYSLGLFCTIILTSAPFIDPFVIAAGSLFQKNGLLAPYFLPLDQCTGLLIVSGAGYHHNQTTTKKTTWHEYIWMYRSASTQQMTWWSVSCLAPFSICQYFSIFPPPSNLDLCPRLNGQVLLAHGMGLKILLTASCRRFQGLSRWILKTITKKCFPRSRVWAC